jgi:hypothetical protein
MYTFIGISEMNFRVVVGSRVRFREQSGRWWKIFQDFLHRIIDVLFPVLRVH